MFETIYNLVVGAVVQLLPLLGKVNKILFEDGGSPLKIIGQILF